MFHAFEAWQTERLSAEVAGTRFHRLLTADFARQRCVDARFARDGTYDGFDGEQVLERRIENSGGARAAVLIRSAPRLWSTHHAQGAAIRPPIEGKHVFSVIAMDEVTFAVRTSSQRLDRIDRSHVGFDNGDNLLVDGMRSDLREGEFSGAHSDSQAGAHVTVKCGRLSCSRVSIE